MPLYIFVEVEWYDKGDSLEIIYLDFSKEFDKVQHKRLIKKLEGYEIQSNVLRWIAEWLRIESSECS